jgi:hypothetical protein
MFRLNNYVGPNKSIKLGEFKKRTVLLRRYRNRKLEISLSSTSFGIKFPERQGISKSHLFKHDYGLGKRLT